MVQPISLRLFRGNDTIEDAETVISELKNRKLYRPRLMYRGFNGNRIALVCEHGSDTPRSDLIYLGDEDDLKVSPHDYGGNMNALYYAFLYKKPALAVYNGDMFIIGDCAQRQRFISPAKKIEALVAVFMLNPSLF